MGEELNPWRLAAGLGPFLFGMHQLEDEISTPLIVNRELLVASHNLIAALVDAPLNMTVARDFASLPAAR